MRQDHLPLLIQILGSDCARGAQLAENAKLAAEQCGFEFQMEQVTGKERLSTFHVSPLPAMLVDGVLRCAGDPPTVTEIMTLLLDKE